MSTTTSGILTPDPDLLENAGGLALMAVTGMENISLPLSFSLL